MKFVGRIEELEKFMALLEDNTSRSYKIIGKPGIGKTSLLKEFSSICDDEKHPHAWIGFDGMKVSTGLEFLQKLIMSSSTLFEQSSTNFSKTDKNSWFVPFVEAVLETKVGKIAEGGFKSFLMLYKDLSNIEVNNLQQKAERTPELFLLHLLKEAGEYHPVLFLDAYEHLLSHNDKIKTNLDFSKEKEFGEEDIRLVYFVEKLTIYLQKHGWLIVSGSRRMRDEKDAFSLENFDDEEILSFAFEKDILKQYITSLTTETTLKSRKEDEEQLLKILKSLSFGGNPLWLSIAVNLVEQLLNDGETLESLAGDDGYVHTCFEKEDDDPFSLEDTKQLEHSHCKLRILEQLAKGIDGFDADTIWKIALPLSLSTDIVTLLYKKDEANAILKTYHLSGIFSVTDKESFKLHEEIQDLLRAYARSKGYLKTDATRVLYKKLKKYIVQKYQDSKDESWMFDATYYAILADDNLFEKGYDVEKFCKAVMGAVSIPLQEKWKIANKKLPILKNSEIENIMNNSVQELEILKKDIGEEVGKELKRDFEKNILSDIKDIDYWKKKVKEIGKTGHYIGLISVMDILKIYDNYIFTIDEMVDNYQNSTNENIQEQCAMVLYRKGFRLGQLGKSEEEIKVYDTLLDRYQNSTNETLQEQCAQALYNKGITLGQLGKSEEAIKVYDTLLEKYQNSTNETLQESCAQALFNKGVRLGQLGKSEEVIEVFDTLLDRYQDSTNETLQESCLSAEANIVEMYMLKGDDKKAIYHAKSVFARVDLKDQESAIMPFLLWLLDDEDTTIESVYGAVEVLDKDIEFSWGFSEIKSMLDSYDENKQKNARYFIEYFEKHHDRELLKERLYAKSRKSCFS